MGTGYTAHDRGTQATSAGPKPAILYSLQVCHLLCETFSFSAAAGIPTWKKRGGKHRWGTLSNYWLCVSSVEAAAISFYFSSLRHVRILAGARGLYLL